MKTPNIRPLLGVGAVIHPNLSRLGNIYSTAVSTAYLSLVNGTAFAQFNLSLADFVGLDAGYTPWTLAVVDSTGKEAKGYIGAAGGGETLGAEIVSNTTFDANTNGWTAVDCTLASIAGGQSNNCCEVTRIGGGNQFGYSPVTVAVSALYKIGGYYKTGTLDKAAQFRYYDSVSGFIYTDNLITSGAWQQSFGYVTTRTTTSGRVYIARVSGADGTTLFDEFSFKQVTDCAATGVRIVSAPAGATRNWASITSGFNPNSISSIKLYRTREIPSL